MTALPTFNAGTEPTAGQLQTLLPVKAVRTVDSTAVNNSTTLVNDSVLFVPVAANAQYEVDLFLVYNSGTTPDFKFGFTAPAGATLVWGDWVPDTAMSSFLSTVQYGADSLATVRGAGGIGADIALRAHGTLITAGSSGTLQVQWSQNTANASNTIVRAGSKLVLRQLA